MSGLRLDTRLGAPATADYEAITPTQAKPNEYSLLDAFMPSATPRASHSSTMQYPTAAAPGLYIPSQAQARSQLSISNPYTQFYEAAAAAAVSAGYRYPQAGHSQYQQQYLEAFSAVPSSATTDQSDLGFSSASDTASTAPGTPPSCRASPGLEFQPLGASHNFANGPDMSLYPQSFHGYDENVQSASVYGTGFIPFYVQEGFASQPYVPSFSNSYPGSGCDTRGTSDAQLVPSSFPSNYSGFNKVLALPDVSSGYRSCGDESSSSTASSTAASPAPSFADFDEAFLASAHPAMYAGSAGYSTDQDEVKPARSGKRSASSSVSSGSDAKDRKSFVCSFPGCGKAFSRNFNLSTHYNTHLGIKPFACPHCPKSFSRRHDCARHVAAVHSVAEANSMRTCGCDCSCATGAHSRDVDPARASSMCAAMDIVKLEEE